MVEAFINRIATAVPSHDVHRFFHRYAASLLSGDPRRRALFLRMAERSGIEHRFSCFAPGDDPDGASLDREGTFRRGGFPGTGTRMEMYRAAAPVLGAAAVDGLLGADEARRVTHLIVTSCTGFSAPGLDLALIERCGLDPSVERTVVGFMGCYAAISGLKLARHIVRAEPAASVLVVNVEICTLHLKETADFEKLLSFCLWGDGAAAALVTAEPNGLRIDGFSALVAPEGAGMMTWDIRDDGFDMLLSGEVPAAIQHLVSTRGERLLGAFRAHELGWWAVHPGGRSVLDAVARGFGLGADDLAASREVLRRFGNMSSATVMFVLDAMFDTVRHGGRGVAMAFGPGLVTEAMLFAGA